jgi:hypothetical protein
MKYGRRSRGQILQIGVAVCRSLLAGPQALALEPIGESLEKSGYGLDAQHRAVVFVGHQVEQSVWTLPYFPDPLPQFAEQRFATQFFGVGVDDTFEVAGPRDLAGAHRADEDVALSERQAASVADQMHVCRSWEAPPWYIFGRDEEN